MSSQKHRVLNHLQDGKFLNQLVATNEYGILRLPARICELRQDGLLHPGTTQVILFKGKFYLFSELEEIYENATAVRD